MNSKLWTDKDVDIALDPDFMEYENEIWVRADTARQGMRELRDIMRGQMNMEFMRGAHEERVNMDETLRSVMDAAAKREEVLKEKLARYIDDEIDHQEFLSPLVKQEELRAYYTELTGRQYGR